MFSYSSHHWLSSMHVNYIHDSYGFRNYPLVNSQLTRWLISINWFYELHSSKRLHESGKSLFFIGKLMISMAIVNSYVKLHKGNSYPMATIFSLGHISIITTSSAGWGHSSAPVPTGVTQRFRFGPRGQSKENNESLAVDFAKSLMTFWWVDLPLWKSLVHWDDYSQYMETCSKPPTMFYHICVKRERETYPYLWM